jgi:hypothetical protein
MKQDMSKTTSHTEVNRHVEDFIEAVNKYKPTPVNGNKESNSNIIPNTSKNNSEIVFFDLNYKRILCKR